MNTLDLTPTQLLYLRAAVDEMLNPYKNRDRLRLSLRHTFISEYEKKDLQDKLEQLKPKPVKV